MGKSKIKITTEPGGLNFVKTSKEEMEFFKKQMMDEIKFRYKGGVAYLDKENKKKALESGLEQLNKPLEQMMTELIEKRLTEITEKYDQGLMENSDIDFLFMLLKQQANNVQERDALIDLAIEALDIETNCKCNKKCSDYDGRFVCETGRCAFVAQTIQKLLQHKDSRGMG